MKDCGLILGTNALVSLGFRVHHANGSLIQPDGVQNREDAPEVLQGTFGQKVCLGPYQSTAVKVQLGERVRGLPHIAGGANRNSHAI